MDYSFEEKIRFLLVVECRSSAGLIIDCHTAVLMKMHWVPEMWERFSHFKPMTNIPFDAAENDTIEMKDFHWILLSRIESKYVALVLFEVESSQVSVSLKGHNAMRKITFQQTFSLGWHTFKTKGHTDCWKKTHVRYK